MSEQLGIFDVPEGERRRDEAIKRVDLHADQQWKAEASAAVADLAWSRETFTTDDVWALLHERGCADWTHEPKAMGGVMQSARRAGWIDPTDGHRLSARPVCHRNPKRVWRSRVYREDPSHAGRPPSAGQPGPPLAAGGRPPAGHSADVPLLAIP